MTESLAAVVFVVGLGVVLLVGVAAVCGLALLWRELTLERAARLSAESAADVRFRDIEAGVLNLAMTGRPAGKRPAGGSLDDDRDEGGDRPPIPRDKEGQEIIDSLEGIAGDPVRATFEAGPRRPGRK